MITVAQPLHKVHVHYFIMENKSLFKLHTILHILVQFLELLGYRLYFVFGTISVI